ncbi:MAG: rhodanese-like domain-containing protein [Ardenticatenaceae bacterium]|nr:rhodanese-like domain-containing protein [Ardenticatenaceae bacterium]
MKKILLILVTLLLMVTACGGGTTGEDTAAIDPTTLPDTIDAKTTAAVKDFDNVLVLDVREQWEYDEGHIPGVTLIPMGEVASRLSEIPTDKEVIVTCRSGNRSGQVADFLRQQGYDNVHNMSGGILAWQEAGLPVE